MKVSEILEKYGDIELENFNIKHVINKDKWRDDINKLIERTYIKIMSILNRKGEVELDDYYSTSLILDKFDNIHLVSLKNQGFYKLEKSIHVFYEVLYYATNGDWCIEDEDDAEKLLCTIYENLEDYIEVDIIETVDKYLEGLI